MASNDFASLEWPVSELITIKTEPGEPGMFEDVERNEENLQVETVEAAEEDDILEMVFLRKPTTMYRHSTIGKLLVETVDELQNQNKVTPELGMKILAQFDRSVLSSLSQRLTARVMFKASKLRSYRFLEGVWTLVLDHVEFREFNSFANVEKVVQDLFPGIKLKIIAFDGKVPTDPRKIAQSNKRRGKDAAEGETDFQMGRVLKGRQSGAGNQWAFVPNA